MIIRDPVHGDLQFTDIERRVIDTRAMQRLRGVRQTGSANLVYPGCVHTRFEHSLGTSAMTKRILFALRANGATISEEEEAVVSLAALVHDISHLPFGHTFEDERKLFPRHDSADRLKYFLSQDDISQALQASGLHHSVLDLITNKQFDPPWMRQVVASTIDADLLDYLRRDAYFAGLRQDYDDRIFSTFTLVDNTLAIDLSRLSTRTEILHLLRLRYFLTERVYYHHAKVSSGAMIAKAVELAIELGLTEKDLYPLTDDTFIHHMLTYQDARIDRLICGFTNRSLLKRAYMLTTAEVGRRGRDEFIATYNRSAEARQKTEGEIADAVALSPDQIILYCPDISSIKEASVNIYTQKGVGQLNAPADNPPFDVRVVEDQYERLWKLYVFAPEGYKIRVGKVCEGIIGEPNALIL
jgi:hypothetical protein